VNNPDGSDTLETLIAMIEERKEQARDDMHVASNELRRATELYNSLTAAWTLLVRGDPVEAERIAREAADKRETARPPEKRVFGPRTTARREAVLGVLSAALTPRSPADIAKSAHLDFDEEIDKWALRDLLSDMVRDGSITRVAHGQYTLPHRQTIPPPSLGADIKLDPKEGP
jgi:hypothetical protein